MAQADVGSAIGAGTDVAVETADIVLVHSNPKGVVSIVELARATYRKMRQNLAWATGCYLLATSLGRARRTASASCSRRLRARCRCL